MANVKEPLRLATITPLYTREMTEIEMATFEWILEREIRILEKELNDFRSWKTSERVYEINAHIDGLKADLEEIRSVA